MRNLPNYEKWLYSIEKFKEEDYWSWFKFAMLWFSFNDYYVERYSHIEREKNKVIEFAKDNEDLYKSLLKKDNFKDVLSDFAKTSSPERTKVKDMRPRSNSKTVFNNRHNSCEKFFEALYQIRCNFFHGDKSPFFEQDKELIGWAYKYLRIFWEEFLKQKREKNSKKYK